MKSRPYKSTDVKSVSVAQVVRNRQGVRCDVGLDTSKREIRVVVRWADGAFERPWQVPLSDLKVLMEKLKELGSGREMFIAMEPTGSYGDPVRQALHDAGLKVYRVSPKASHDYSEILDGVPSQHDGKDAACVAELSSMQKRQEWRWEESGLELRYEIEWMDTHQQMLTRLLGRLEGLLGRFWPEATDWLELSSATLLRTLEHYGSAEALAADAEAESRLQRWGGAQLKREKIRGLIASARQTVGVRVQRADVQQVQRYARTALLIRHEQEESRKELARLTKGNEVVERQSKVVGRATAAVLWARLGDPKKYHSGAAYRKAMGLNLKERSSGTWQGQLKITKRGSSQVRRWLYFAALRWCQDPWIRPWYEKKKKRGEGHAKRALIALMRKLALALYYVGVEGRPFDVRKLLPEAGRSSSKRSRGGRRVA